MSYNQQLEDRIDHHFIDREEIVKKKQMGGIGWLIQGNMCCGVYENLLVVRVDPSLVNALIKKPDIHLFSHREGTEDSILSITEKIYTHPKALRKFLSHCLEYTASLPPKNVSGRPAVQ